MFYRVLNVEPLPRILLGGLAVLLAGCGQVVTPSPTQTLPSAMTLTGPSAGPMYRPTGTAVPLPPLDTATPTVTPTPVVHVVQQGDTLQAIAFDYGVGVDVLQRANGIENPQLLQVGQRLVIPLGEESDETASGLLPTPTPQPVQVQGEAFYETPVGSLWALGEVANTTGVTLTNVLVKVTLFDATGEPVAENDAFAAADLVPPGASSPFGLLFATAPDWSSYQMTVLRADETRGLADAYVPMSVTEVDGRSSDSQFRVSGTVKHVGTAQVASSVDVIVTVYNAEGSVTGFRQHTVKLDEGLIPGATRAFTVLLTAHGGSPDDFSVIALGRVSGM
jgi:LysM repeat protein